ncbi:MAG: hypothetical protein V7459_02810 [Oceanicoccus sp.]
MLTNILIASVAVVAIVFAVLLLKNQAGSPAGESTESQYSKVPSADTANDSSAKLFEDLYSQYVTDYEQDLRRLTELSVYDIEAEQLISEIDDVLSLANSGKLSKAVAKLTTTLKNIEELYKKRDQHIEELGKSINQALELNAFSRAEATMEKFIAISPADPRIADWSLSIERLPKLLSANREAHRARQENRPADELAQLRIVRQLDPADSSVSERIQTIESQIKSDTYFDHIEYARNAFDRGLFSDALKQLSKAEKTDPAGKEIAVMRKKIAGEQTKRDQLNYIDNAENAVKNDNWQAAFKNYDLAIKRGSTLTSVANGYQLSKSIVEARAEVQRLLADPLRLSDPAVLRHANLLISNTQAYTSHSASYNNQLDMLSKLLLRAGEKRPLTIISDGLARIKVQGVGYVNPTDKTIIQLLPGRYKLFAQCKGYRDNLVEVTLPLDGVIAPVRVTCDERI